MIKKVGIEAVLELLKHDEHISSPYPSLLVNGVEVVDFGRLGDAQQLSAAAFRCWLATLEMAAALGRSQRISVAADVLEKWDLLDEAYRPAAQELASAGWIDICDVQDDGQPLLVSLPVLPVIRKARETHLASVVVKAREELLSTIEDLATGFGVEFHDPPLPGLSEEEYGILQLAIYTVLLGRD